MSELSETRQCAHFDSTVSKARQQAESSHWTRLLQPLCQGVDRLCDDMLPPSSASSGTNTVIGHTGPFPLGAGEFCLVHPSPWPLRLLALQVMFDPLHSLFFLPSPPWSLTPSSYNHFWPSYCRSPLTESSKLYLYFYFNMYVLFEGHSSRRRGRERQRDLPPAALFPLNVCNGQGWSGPKPGARNTTWAAGAAARGPSSAVFTGAFVGSRVRSGASGLQPALILNAHVAGGSLTHFFTWPDPHSTF